MKKKIIVAGTPAECEPDRELIQQYGMEYQGVEYEWCPSELSDINASECILFLLNPMDLERARMVWKSGIRDVKLILDHSVILDCGNESAAEELERAYLAKGDYRRLKQLNRIRMLLSYFNRENRLRSLPLEIQIESTSYCNAECIMCGHYVYKNAIARHMPGELTQGLEKYLPYVETVILHGNGEPFLEPDLISRILLYRKYGIRVVTNTNLSVLPQALLEIIPDNFQELTVSIDGCTPEIYEGIRTHLSFKTLLKNIGRLNEAAPDLPKKMAVVVMRQNLHQIPEFIEFAHRYGFYGVNYIALGSSEIVSNEGDEIRNFPNLAHAAFKKAVALAEKYHISIEMPGNVFREGAPDPEGMAAEEAHISSSPFFPDPSFQEELFVKYVQPRLEELRCKPEQEIVYSDYTSSRMEGWDTACSLEQMGCRGNCDSLMFRPFINLDGKVFACCQHTKLFLGDMGRGEDLQQIWNGQRLRELREQFYEGNVPAYCGGCSFMSNGFLMMGDFDDGGFCNEQQKI